ncbi:RNA polymerase sigma-70 factor [Fulvivirga ligni]|uniref:RNA polymerase sigma-70 factor n=1 Tax=Fulvivirga ligni TaxID=2904246 RepID=UPI001F1D143B|nr:RNA polymerase sigma-70 factor [Fulvivirga ligni]UII24279.1 RNA polymerase sigma-70 factor [Fulvivirga ligni]
MTRKIHKLSNVANRSDKEWEAYFEGIYKEYFKRLYAYVRVIVDSQSLAKDVVSDFFLALWKNRNSLLHVNDLEVYLFVSVRNQAVQALQKQAKLFSSREALEVKLESIDYINPEELLLEKELLNLLKKITSELPDQCKLIFEMATERGLKNAEIAQELGISVVTVKSQKRKAQVKIKAGIIKYYHDHDDSNLPDIRMISQYLLVLGYIHCEF